MSSVSIITGASSGFGQDLARLFAKDKKDLVLVARRKERLDIFAAELSNTFGIKVYIIAQDLSEVGAAIKIIKEVESKKLRILTLVNNAGTLVHGKFQDTDIIKDMEMIQINLIALTELTKLSIEHMKKYNEGKILNVGSIGSFMPGPHEAIYQGTKAYVLSFSEAIAEDLMGTGISVTVLCPGPMKTELSGKAGMDNTFLFKYMTMPSHRVASRGYKDMLKKKRISVPGLLNRFQIFSIRFTPRILVVKISKLLLK